MTKNSTITKKRTLVSIPDPFRPSVHRKVAEAALGLLRLELEGIELEVRWM
jgi:hypothetical protein